MQARDWGLRRGRRKACLRSAKVSGPPHPEAPGVFPLAPLLLRVPSLGSGGQICDPGAPRAGDSERPGTRMVFRLEAIPLRAWISEASEPSTRCSLETGGVLGHPWPSSS